MSSPLPVEPRPPEPVGHEPSLARSFGHAFEGVVVGRAERNFRIHLCAGSAVLGAGALLPFSTGERLALVLCVGAVVAAELFNTAVEAAVDLQTSTFHPLAKRAKDAAAGGVLVLAAMSVVVGLVIVHAHRTEWLVMRDRFMSGLPAWIGQMAATVALVAAPMKRNVRRVVLVGGLAAGIGLVGAGASAPVALAGAVLLAVAAAGGVQAE